MNKIKYFLSLFIGFTFFRYYQYRSFHKYPSKYKVDPSSHGFNSYEEFSIVLQGPCRTKRDRNFLLETIKYYKKIFPGAEIIVSLWDDGSIGFIEKIGGIIVVSEKKRVIDGPVENSVNYQIISASNGIKKATRNFCVKTRVDQRIYNPETLAYFSGILKNFPIPSTMNKHGLYSPRGRIISGGIRLKKLYSVSDHLLCGYREDLLTYFSPRMATSEDNMSFLPNRKFMAESWFCIEFLKKIGCDVKFNLDESLYLLGGYFFIINYESIGLFWNKYEYNRIDVLESSKSSSFWISNCLIK